MRIPALAAEVLEARQVMSGTPLDPTQLANKVSNAQTDKQNADLGLQNAKTNFTTQTTNAVNSLHGALTGLTTTAQGLIDGQKGTVQGLIDGAKTTLDGAIHGLETALQGTLDGFKTTLDGALTNANTTHQQQVDAANQQFQTDFNTIKSGHDSTVAGLLSGFQSNVDAAKGIFDGVVSGALSTFDGAVSGPGGFDDQFNGGVTSETNTYNTNESNDWTNLYLNVVGTGPTGLQTIYNNAVSVADGVLAGVLAANPGVTYDPSAILDSSNYQSYVDGQLTSLQSHLPGDQSTHDTNVTNRLTQLDGQINGPTGVLTAFNNQIKGLEDGFQHDADTLGGQLASDLQGDQDSYNQAVTGPGGLGDQLKSALNGDETTFKNASSTAEGQYDSTMAGPKSSLENTVDSDVNGFENWLTDSNPHKLAMDLRVDALKDELQGLLATYNQSASDARDQLQSAVLASNQLYWDHVYKPNATPPSAYDVYLGVVNSQQSSLSGNLQSDFGQYQNDAQNFWNAFNAAMMNWMNNGMVGTPPSPNMSVLDGYAKTYWVAADTDGANETDAIGAAYVAFVNTAVAEDTTREQSVDTAQAQYATDLENAKDALANSFIAAMQSFENDAIDLSHAFAEDATSRFLTAEGDIDTALNIYDLAQNSAFDQFMKDGNSALRDYEKNSANDLDNIEHQEDQKWEQLEVGFAGHEASYENQMAAKDKTLADSEASALDGVEHSVDALDNQAEKDLAGYDETLKQSATADLLTFFTNLANELATEYAAASGGAIDVVTVANAEAQNIIAKLTAWKSAVDGEATAFKNYADHESDDRKTADDNIATGSENRAHQVAGQWLTWATSVIGAALQEVQTLAPQEQAMSDSIADQDRDAAKNLADKEKVADDALADADKQQADGRSNAGHSFVQQTLGAIGPTFTAEDNLAKGCDHTTVNLQFSLWSFVESQIHGVATSSITQTKNAAINLAAMDDAFINAKADDEAATSSNNAWQLVNTTNSEPTSDFDNKLPTGPSGSMSMLPMMPGRLERPTAATGTFSDSNLAALLGNQTPQQLQPSTSTGLSFPPVWTLSIPGNQNTVIRYVGEMEAKIALQTGFIPNTNRLEVPKAVFVTPERLVPLAPLAELRYQIGSQNPVGPTATPTHVIIGDPRGVAFDYAGKVNGGTGIEMTTRVRIPVQTAFPIDQGPGFFRSNAASLGWAAGLSALNGVATAVNSWGIKVAIRDVTNANTAPETALRQLSYLQGQFDDKTSGIGYAISAVLTGSVAERQKEQREGQRLLDQMGEYWTNRLIDDALPPPGRTILDGINR